MGYGIRDGADYSTLFNNPRAMTLTPMACASKMQSSTHLWILGFSNPILYCPAPDPVNVMMHNEDDVDDE
jgi:hypothetical protein